MDLLNSLLQKATNAVTQNPQQSGTGSNGLSDYLHKQTQDFSKYAATQNAYVTKNPGAIAGAVDPGVGIANKGLPFLSKMGEAISSDIGKVIAPDAAQSLQGAAHTTTIQNALRRNGVNNYKQVGPAANKLYTDVINPVLSKSAKLVKLDDVTGDIVNEMQKMEPGLDFQDAKKAAHGVINSLYTSAKGVAGQNAVVPDYIDTPSLFSIKTNLNSTNAVKNYFNGITPSTSPAIATVASRNALAKIIESAHPEISQATRDYSALKDAVPGLFKAAQQSKGIGIPNPLAPTSKIGIPGVIANPVIRQPVGAGLKVAGSISGTPLGKVLGLGALGVGAGAGLEAGKNIVNGFNQENSANADNGSGSNQQSESGINGNHTSSSISQNRYQVNSDPIKSGQLMQTQDFTNQDNQLTQQIANAKASGDVVSMAKLQGQQAQLQNSFANQKQLRDAWTDPVRGTGNVLTVGNQAYSSIQKADPGFFNALNGGYDKLLSSSNKNYAQMGGYLAYVSQATGTDFTKYKTKSALIGALDSAMSNQKTQWETLQKQYQGSSKPMPTRLQRVLQPSAPNMANFPPVGGTGDVNMNAGQVTQ